MEIKRRIKEFLETDRGDRFLLYAIALAFVLAIGFAVVYTRSISVEYSCEGLKYQSGIQQSGEPIHIEVCGKYEKLLFSKDINFRGTIRVGERTFECHPLIINQYKMGYLGSSDFHYGDIYVSNDLKQLTIILLEVNQNGGYSWGSNGGWLISAPCTDREEAVKISNTLMRGLHKDSIIQ